MAGVDLTGKDPWGAIGSTKAGGILGDAAPVLGTMTGGADWLSVGMSVLSGVFGGSKTDVSGAGAGGASALNTSGWVVGEGDAAGGGLESSLNEALADPKSWPWYAYAAGALVAIAIIKKAVK